MKVVAGEEAIKGWFSDCVKKVFEPKTELVANVQLYSRLEFGKTCAGGHAPWIASLAISPLAKKNGVFIK